MSNRFHDKTMRSQYDAAVKVYRMKHRDLFINGERRTEGQYGSSFAQYFWHGFDGIVPCVWDAGRRKMLGYAYWRAGQDCAKDAARGPQSKARDMKPTPENTNHYQGVYYMTREQAESAAPLYMATIEKRNRGFVVVLQDGTLLGPQSECDHQSDPE